MATKKQTKVAAGDSSFLTGLGVGLFAGAIGFYLFNTKKGEEFRRALQEEWQEIRQRLYEEGVIPSPDLSVGAAVSGYLTELAEWFSQLDEGDKKQKKLPKSEEPAKFKGV